MAQGHTYRVRTRGTLRGQQVEFGLHLRQDGTTGSASNLASHWATTIVPLVVAATSLEVNWTELIVSDTDPAGDESYHFPLTQPMPGAVTGDALPGQNAGVVSLSTGQKGRRRHGRFYLPGLSETYQTNGNIIGAQLTAMQALAFGLVSAYGPAGSQGSFHMVVYSPIDVTPPPVKPFRPKNELIVTPIQNALVDPIVRTQRRRAIGVGR